MADAPAAPAAEATPPVAPAETAPSAGEVPTVESLQAELDKWKEMSRRTERDAKKAQTELDRLRQSAMTEQERAVQAAREQGRSEAIAETLAEQVQDKIKIAASGKFVDPSDVPALLRDSGGLDRFIDGSVVDTKAIERAVDQLIKDKPYLSPRPGVGAGEGGPRGTTPSTTNDPLLSAVTRMAGGN